MSETPDLQTEADETSSQAALCAAISRPSGPGPICITSVAVRGKVASASWSAAWVPIEAPSREAKGFMVGVLRRRPDRRYPPAAPNSALE